MATAQQEARDAITGGSIAGESCDEEMVAGLRAGRRAAFETFVGLYQTSIYNLALRILQDREDARDVAQEVFLKAYKQLPVMTGELKLRPWMYRVTVNACYDQLRSGRRRPLIGEGEVEMHAEPVDGVEQAELARMFRETVRTLSQRQQIALLLKDVHGLPHCEIAESLGISRGSAEVLLFRARHSFRRTFEGMAAAPERAAACTFAERVAAEAVGGRLSDARHRRILRHAEHCPHCRQTMESWHGVVIGLGVALPLVAVGELFHASSAAAAVAVSAAAASAASASGSAISAGLLAKLVTLLSAKAVTVAAATTCLVTAGGVTAYEVEHHAAPARSPSGAPAKAATHAAQPVAASGAPLVIHLKGDGHVNTMMEKAGRGPAAAAPLTSTPVPQIRIPSDGSVHTKKIVRIRHHRVHVQVVPIVRHREHPQHPITPHTPGLPPVTHSPHPPQSTPVPMPRPFDHHGAGSQAHRGEEAADRSGAQRPRNGGEMSTTLLDLRLPPWPAFSLTSWSLTSWARVVS